MNDRVYLDHASATPVRPEVLTAMLPYFSERFGNASAIHAEGRTARAALEAARERIARLLAVRPSGVTFTSGGTEANNLALFGICDALHAAGRAYSDMEVLTTPTEHPSILEACAVLERRGVHIAHMPIREDGRIDLQQLTSVFSPHTVLVTFAYANSETGVVQDVRAVVRAAEGYARAHGMEIAIHLDAAQAPLWLPLGMDALGVTHMTLDAGKCMGPKGVGVLAHKYGAALTAEQVGGGQEAGLRAGTEPVALAVGMAEALVHAVEGREARAQHASRLRDMLRTKMYQLFGAAVIENGSELYRLPNTLNVSLPGMDTEYAVVWLDTHGVAVSTRSACGSADTTGSHVIRAMTGDTARATSTLRVTLGEMSTESDIQKCVDVLTEWYALMRSEKVL